MQRGMLGAIAGGILLVGLGYGAGQIVSMWQSPARISFDNQSTMPISSIVFTGSADGLAPGQQVTIDYRPPVPTGQMIGEASVAVQVVFEDGSTANANDIYIENGSKVRLDIAADKSMTAR